MEHLVRKYKRGEISFVEFVDKTEKYWQTMAGDFLDKWDHPAAVERDDLVQEMLLTAWHQLETWEDGRESSGKKWVVFGAMKSARRWFHLQRGAKDFACCRRDRDPRAKFPICTGTVSPDVCDSEDFMRGQTGTISLHEEAMALDEFRRLAQNEVDEMVIDALLRMKSRKEVIVRLAMFLRDRTPNQPNTKKKTRGVVKLSTGDLERAKAMYLEYLEYFTEEVANV